MLSIEHNFIVDFISAFWMLTMVGVLLLWLPIKSMASHSKPIDNTQILGLWLRTMSFILMGVLILSGVGLLNWLTLTLLYSGCLLANYFKKYRWQIKNVREVIQQKTIDLIDFLDSGISLNDLWQTIQTNFQKIVQTIADYITSAIATQGMVFVFLLVGVLTFSLLLRWEYPLSQLRLSHPDRYSTLLITRQLLTNNYPSLSYLPVFSALAATISLLGSIEPMQTIRFLSPIMGVALVIAVGYTVRVFTNNANAALTAILALGGYLFTWQQTVDLQPQWLNTIIASLNDSSIRQWAGNELELGTIFLLLGLGYCFSCDRQQRNTVTFRINLLCGLILVGMSTPSLLVIVAIACIGLIGDKKLTLTTIVSGWILLAVFAAIAPNLIWMQSFLLTLPVALSLLVGLIFAVVSDALVPSTGKWTEMFSLGLIVALSLNFWLPPAPTLTYLEYDLAARKTLEIKKYFPAKTWTLVAPVEQLAEIYGSGWYEDLALFVENYGNQTYKPQFKFPASGQDLFVIVEKIPFVTFPNEPSLLPNSILSDRTYRYYRSSAGRASLEYEALQMCEAYRRNHHNTSEIYYEDDELRIYHFNLADSQA